MTATPQAGKPAPDCVGYINTHEGWALYAQCSKTGDFAPYLEAREVYCKRCGMCRKGTEG